jgi:hypothetical protein
VLFRSEQLGATLVEILPVASAVDLYKESLGGLTAFMKNYLTEQGRLQYFFGATDSTKIEAEIELQKKKNAERAAGEKEAAVLSIAEEEKIAKANKKYAKQVRENMKEIGVAQLKLEQQRRDASNEQMKDLERLESQRDEANRMLRDARELRSSGLELQGIELQIEAEKRLAGVEKERMSLRKQFNEDVRKIGDSQLKANIEQMSAEEQINALIEWRAKVMEQAKAAKDPERQLELLEEELNLRQQIQSALMGQAAALGGSRSAGKAIQAGTSEAYSAVKASRTPNLNAKVLEKYNQLTAKYTEESAKALGVISRKLDLKTARVAQ